MDRCGRTYTISEPMYENIRTQCEGDHVCPECIAALTAERDALNRIVDALAEKVATVEAERDALKAELAIAEEKLRWKRFPEEKPPKEKEGEYYLCMMPKFKKEFLVCWQEKLWDVNGITYWLEVFPPEDVDKPNGCLTPPP